MLAFVKKVKLSNYKFDEHIPFLQQEISAQLQHIKSHLSTDEQITLFSQFENEFKQREQDQRISYEWWIALAYRLSILVTPEQFRSSGRVASPEMDDREDLPVVAQVLRDDPGLRFEFCTGSAACTTPTTPARELHAVYHLLSMTHNRRIRARGHLPRRRPAHPQRGGDLPDQRLARARDLRLLRASSSTVTPR